MCFRHRAGDEFNEVLLESLNQSGAVYLTHTRLNDRFTLRLCVGQTNTELCHVEQAWAAIQRETHQIETDHATRFFTKEGDAGKATSPGS